MIKTNSYNAFKLAKQHIPGGVNSPARAFKSVGSTPPCIKRAYGSRIADIDGNEYIDYVGSWGPMILGHAFHKVVEELQNAATNGTSYGAPTEIETEVAELVKKMVPSVELIRMVNSGTEATMSAIRLARGYTKRNFIVKFEGCYHGHSDSFLIKAGSGALTHGSPDSPGVTANIANDTLIATYNKLESVTELFEKNGENIAAVILEPIAGNMGVVKAETDFLTGIKELCEKHGALLIFDEVMTGFRVAPGGAQELFNITPDLTTFGKIIGGGLPVGAFGGKREIMEHLAPSGPVYQAGTLSGNPLAMAAGRAVLRELHTDRDIYYQLEKKTHRLVNGLRDNFIKVGIPAVVNRVGSMFTVFLTERVQVNTFEDVMTCDQKLFAQYFNLSLEAGIYLAPSQFEALFVSVAHSQEDIKKTIQANYEVLTELKD